MRNLIITFALLLFFTFCKAQDTNTIQGNGTITTLDKNDIVEINKARHLLIIQILKEAENHKSPLMNLLQKDYQDARDNAHNSDRQISKYYPRTITKTSFLTYYISKAVFTRCYKNEKDTSHYDCTEQRQYQFLVLFPYIDGSSHGDNFESTQFLIHFEKITKWIEDRTGNKTSITTNYNFSDPVPLLIRYGFKCMTRDNE